MADAIYAKAARRRRRNTIKSLILLVVLAAAGAMFDPSIVAPFGPLADRPERIDATFTRCGQGARGFACVVDGDTLRLGPRRVRITGIDAPEIGDHASCPAERALAEKSAARLVALVNQGPFDLIAHRLNGRDNYGRDLRVVQRGDVSIGDQLIAEGLAHRYRGMKTGWC